MRDQILPMDTLLSSLKEKDLKSIKNEVHSFFGDSQKYPNKLKLSIVTATIIEEALAVLASINYDDYIKELSKKLDSLSSMAIESKKKHSSHRELDSILLYDLGEDGNKNLVSFDEQIGEYLDRLDKALRQIVELRDKLPIAQIVEKQQV